MELIYVFSPLPIFAHFSLLQKRIDEKFEFTVWYIYDWKLHWQAFSFLFTLFLQF